MPSSDKELKESVDQLSHTIMWLVQMYAEARTMSMAEAAEQLALQAPKKFMAQSMGIAAQCFRMRGL